MCCSDKEVGLFLFLKIRITMNNFIPPNLPQLNTSGGGGERGDRYARRVLSMARRMTSCLGLPIYFGFQTVEL